MAKEFPSIKYARSIKPYKRKVKGRTVPVAGYTQTYIAPRGPVKRVTRDRSTSKSQTMWLMDKQGHFVGRANYNGDTTAQGGIYKWGYDATTNIRDARKYKRIFGRTNPTRTRRIRQRR